MPPVRSGFVVIVVPSARAQVPPPLAQFPVLPSFGDRPAWIARAAAPLVRPVRRRVARPLGWVARERPASGLVARPAESAALPRAPSQLRTTMHSDWNGA